jgi:hypothetical protein
MVENGRAKFGEPRPEPNFDFAGDKEVPPFYKADIGESRNQKNINLAPSRGGLTRSATLTPLT